MRKVCAAIVFFLILPFVYCEESFVESLKEQYDMVMAHEEGSTIKKYIEELEKEQYSDIQKSITDVFIGSMYSKLADLDLLFWNKIFYVNKGVKLMKLGMSEITQNGENTLSEKDLLILHLTYGITSGYIPKAFQNPIVGIEQLELALAMNDFCIVEKKVKVEAYMLLSEGYKEIKNTEKYLSYQYEAKQMDKSLYDALLKKKK